MVEASSRAVRKIVTLLFTDVSGSTAMGEGRDPETIRAIMDRYFASMRAVIERHGGTVEKFVGDAVMAAFGIPILHEDDALRAVRAAVEMREQLSELNDDLDREWSIRIAIRTGVNTGEVIAGDSVTRETFATGDTVNTTARLEQAAGAGEILLGEATYRLVRHAVETEPVEPLVLKGKAEPVPAYRLIGVGKVTSTRPVRREGVLIGRDLELAAILGSMDAARETDTCRLVTVIGSPGVGKSRLVEEAVSSRGARVLRGGCLSYGEGITFWPIVQMIRRAAHIADDDPPDRVRELVRGLGGATGAGDRLLDLLGLLGPGERSPGIEETYRAVTSLFGSLAAEWLLAVVIEDIHWAEPGLLGLIDHVVARGVGPITVICTARPELLDGSGSWGEETDRRTPILLAPLDEQAASDLVRSRVGDLPEPLAAVIVGAAGGNPLFVEELLSCTWIAVSCSAGPMGGWWSETLSIWLLLRPSPR